MAIRERSFAKVNIALLTFVCYESQYRQHYNKILRFHSNKKVNSVLLSFANNFSLSQKRPIFVIRKIQKVRSSLKATDRRHHKICKFSFLIFMVRRCLDLSDKRTLGYKNWVFFRLNWNFIFLYFFSYRQISYFKVNF